MGKSMFNLNWLVSSIWKFRLADHKKLNAINDSNAESECTRSQTTSCHATAIRHRLVASFAVEEQSPCVARLSAAELASGCGVRRSDYRGNTVKGNPDPSIGACASHFTACLVD